MQNLKKLPDFALKRFKTTFFSGVTSSNPSARLEKLRWPVMIGKFRGQKYSKNFKIADFNKNLAKIQYSKIFKTILLSQKTIHYSYFKL